MTGRASDHLYTLHRNPFALAPVIQNFYLEWTPMEKDVLLSYLILPLVTYPAMKSYLNNAGRNSSIRTMASDASRLVGLTLRLEEYKPITNTSLLILRAEGSMSLAEDLSVVAEGNPQAANADKEMLRYATKLSMIFRNESVVTIYRMLGLKSL